MPAATSPYQNNDYQAVSSLRPYKLPVNDIFKAIVSQDQFWEEGASRVKNVYENALNLNLTLNENKQIRDDFMKKAEEEMTKLSSMKLSDPSVQRKGFDIFKPLLQDHAIVQDDYLTKQRAGVLSEAEKYKNDVKTKGQGFHLDNLQYALRPFKGFGENTSRAELGNVFQNAKDATYTPYYDVSKERLDILDKCKGNKISGTTSSGPYLNTTSDKSLYQSKLNGCLEGGLSDQARQQMRISGAVRYGDNYDALRNDYLQTAEGKKSYYESEKSELMAKRAALAKTGGDVDQIDQLITQYNEGIKSQDNRIKDVSKWDNNYMKDNYEDLAYQSYFQKANGSFAAAFSMQDIDNDMKSNPIWITQFVQNEINGRQDRDFKHDYIIKDLDLRNKLLTGKNADGTDMDAITRMKMVINSGGDLNDAYGMFLTQAIESDGTSAGKLLGEINTAQNTEQQIITDLISTVKANPTLRDALKSLNIESNTKTSEQYKQLWRTLNAYSDTTLKSDPNDPLASQIRDTHNELVRLGNRKAMLKGVYDDAKGQLDTSNPTISQNFQNAQKSLLEDFTGYNNDKLKIDKNKLQSIINGTDTDYELTSTTSKSDSVGSSLLPAFKNKKTGEITAAPAGFNRVRISSYLDKLKTKDTDYLKEFDNILSKNTVIQRMGLSTGNLIAKDSPALRDMETWFGGSLGIIGKDINFTTVGPFDIQTGKVRINATNKDGEAISAKDMISAIAKQGKGVSPGNDDYRIVNDETLEIKLPSAQNLIKKMTYADELRQLLQYTENKMASNPRSIPASGISIEVGRSQKGQRYSMKITKSITSNTPNYVIVADDGVEFAPINKGLNPKENLIQTLNNLLDNTLDKINVPK